jgi:hypothetical protein
LFDIGCLSRRIEYFAARDPAFIFRHSAILPRCDAYLRLQ